MMLDRFIYQYNAPTVRLYSYLDCPKGFVVSTLVLAVRNPKPEAEMREANPEAMIIRADK